MNRGTKFDLNVGEDGDVAYLRMPGHPGSRSGIVKKLVRLRDVIGDYKGPDVSFDLDADNRLIGIEIID